MGSNCRVKQAKPHTRRLGHDKEKETLWEKLNVF